MSSTRRGCTAECFYSTGPASGCTCACGGAHHGKGAQTAQTGGEVRTVGGQAFIPVSGSDSRPAGTAPPSAAKRLRTDEQLRYLLDREQQRAFTYHDKPNYERVLAVAESHHEAGRYTDADMARLREMADERRPPAPVQAEAPAAPAPDEHAYAVQHLTGRVEQADRKIAELQAQPVSAVTVRQIQGVQAIKDTAQRELAEVQANAAAPVQSESVSWDEAATWQPTERGSWDTVRKDYEFNHPLVMRALREDVAEKGMLTPIEVTPDGRVLRGHHRWLVAQDLGLASVPVIYTDRPLPEDVEWNPHTREHVPYVDEWDDDD